MYYPNNEPFSMSHFQTDKQYIPNKVLIILFLFMYRYKHILRITYQFVLKVSYQQPYAHVNMVRCSHIYDKFKWHAQPATCLDTASPHVTPNQSHYLPCHGRTRLRLPSTPLPETTGLDDPDFAALLNPSHSGTVSSIQSKPCMA